jgi:hypothetical protein
MDMETTKNELLDKKDIINTHDELVDDNPDWKADYEDLNGSIKKRKSKISHTYFVKDNFRNCNENDYKRDSTKTKKCHLNAVLDWNVYGQFDDSFFDDDDAFYETLDDEAFCEREMYLEYVRAFYEPYSDFEMNYEFDEYESDEYEEEYEDESDDFRSNSD